MIRKIAEYFNTSLVYLLDGKEEIKTPPKLTSYDKKGNEIKDAPVKFTCPSTSFEETQSENIPNSGGKKYDASIRVSLSTEKIESLKEINRIYKKIENKENLTKDELQILKDDNERQRTAMKHLQETLRTMQEKLIPAYEKLNKTGQEEAAKRIEELTEIPRYTKPPAPPRGITKPIWFLLINRGIHQIRGGSFI